MLLYITCYSPILVPDTSLTSDSCKGTTCYIRRSMWSVWCCQIIGVLHTVCSTKPLQGLFVFQSGQVACSHSSPLHPVRHLHCLGRLSLSRAAHTKRNDTLTDSQGSGHSLAHWTLGFLLSNSFTPPLPSLVNSSAQSGLPVFSLHWNCDNFYRVGYCLCYLELSTTKLSFPFNLRVND